MKTYSCPMCGEFLNEWGGGIYECNYCGNDFPEDALTELEEYADLYDQEFEED